MEASQIILIAESCARKAVEVTGCMDAHCVHNEDNKCTDDSCGLIRSAIIMDIIRCTEVGDARL